MRAAHSLPALAPVEDSLTSLLDEFRGASLELLRERDLLRRVDSKFVIGASRLPQVIAALITDYDALRVPSGNVATYRSLYFDTPALRCFHDHRCGRRVRHKVRIRHYPDRELSYLEIKTKRNEAITDKQRLQVAFGEERLGAAELDFLRAHVGAMADELRPELRVDFRRVSLIGARTQERVTIDLELAIGSGEHRWRMDGLAVIEVKQSPFCVRSPVMRAVRAVGLRERSMSKYSTGIAMTRPHVRHNRMLPDLRALERITK